MLAAAYLKYRRCRLSCLPFVWHFFFIVTHTHTPRQTHFSAYTQRSNLVAHLKSTKFNFSLSQQFTFGHRSRHASERVKKNSLYELIFEHEKMPSTIFLTVNDFAQTFFNFRKFSCFTHAHCQSMLRNSFAYFMKGETFLHETQVR